MKVFLDTNVIIDFYDRRDKFFYPAAIIFDLAYKGKIQLYVSAITFVNAFFLLRKSYEREDLYKSMRGLASLCEITDVDKGVIKKSLEEKRTDFEDSVQFESSLPYEVDVIVTRNLKDFKGFASNVQSPEEFLNSFCRNTDEDDEGKQ